MKKIVIIEPAWPDNIHFPFNSGLLRTVADAYPSAEIIFIGSALQNRKIAASLPQAISHRCEFRDWKVYSDPDTLPANILARSSRLYKTAAHPIATSDLVILTSVTGTTLTSIAAMLRPRHQQLQIYLHGNLNDLHGWRSRNPLRRFGDLYSALKRAAWTNCKFIVLEEHIRSRAASTFPWMAGKLHFFPHPLRTEETLTITKKLSFPIKIGLAGISSPDKGFAQFRELATRLKTKFPGVFQFHAIGKRHPSNQDADFKDLDTAPREGQLERADFLKQIDDMHFLFFWPTGDYYKNASSGVFYDALNRKIPLLSKSDLRAFHPAIQSMGIICDTLDELELAITQVSDNEYQSYNDGLSSFSENFRHGALVNRFRYLVENFAEASPETINLTQINSMESHSKIGSV